MYSKSRAYTPVAIALHWIMAILIIGLFILGEYMVDLSYYDAWYNLAPHWHRSLGILTCFLLIIRLVWRWSHRQPEMKGALWEQHIAKAVHRFFYILLVVIIGSGYLITTADGQAISVFDWFEVPAILYGYDNQEDTAGEIHELSATLLILLVIVHTLAALKHHFFDHDDTLMRMLRLK